MSSINEKQQPQPSTSETSKYGCPTIPTPEQAMSGYRFSIVAPYKSPVTLPPPGGIAVLRNPGERRLYYKYCQPITIYWEERAIRVYFKKCRIHGIPHIVHYDQESTFEHMRRSWYCFVDGGSSIDFSDTRSAIVMHVSTPMNKAYVTPPDEAVGVVRSMHPRINPVSFPTANPMDVTLKSLQEIAAKIQSSYIEYGKSFISTVSSENSVQSVKNLIEDSAESLNREMRLALEKTLELRNLIQMKHIQPSHSFQVVLPKDNKLRSEQKTQNEEPSSSDSGRYQLCTVEKTYTHFWMLM